MKKILAMTAAFVCTFCAMAAGFDGYALTTNDWFDASFTALTADTVIAQGDTTGITGGAGSWTAVPTTGSATIAADADAGGEATLLSLSAPGEELTFTPAPFATTSGYETVSVELKADAIDELPEVGNDVQAAFTVLLDENDALSAQGWTATGWTNLVYAATDDLTNAWFTLSVDFANVSGVRYVRYSVKPAAGALSALADGAGTTWFQAGKNADALQSVSFSGTGAIRSFSGDELDPIAVATYNSVGYISVEEAIAAAVADGWANGNVVLQSDAEWQPAATGTYNIDANSHTLTVNGAAFTVAGTVYTVSGYKYYWIGPADGEWASNSNWSRTEGGSAAGAYPSATDDAEFSSDASVTISSGNANVANLTLRGNVTITGSTAISATKNSSGKTNGLTGNMLLYSSISGSGKVLTLKTAGLRSNTANASIGCDVNVPVGYTAAFFCNNYTILMNGRLTGAGDVIEYQAGNSNGVTYSADCSGFSGTITEKIYGDYERSRLQLASGAVSFRNATINSMSYQFSQNVQYLIGTSQDTYYIGAFNGPLQIWQSKPTIYLGGKNEDCEISGIFSRGKKDNSNYWPATIVKEGTARLTSTCTQIAYLEIQNGVFEIASATPMYDSIVSPWIKFTGGTLVCTPVDGACFDPSSYIKNSTSAIVFDVEGVDCVWASALADSNTGGLTKKGTGTLTLGAMPAYTGTTTIEAGCLVVPQGTTIAELSCAGGKLTVPLVGTEDETEVLTISALADGTSYEDLTNAVAVVGATMNAVADGDGGYTVKATRKPLTFTWTGEEDSKWSNPGNWNVGGVVPMSAPVAVDDVVFPANSDDGFSGWNVFLDADETVASVQFSAATTLSNALICCSAVSATDTVTLGDGAGFADTGSGLSLASMNVEITASTNRPARFRRTTSAGELTIPATCVIAGTGAFRLECAVDMGSNNGTQLGATMGDFKGTVYLVRADGGSQRDNTRLAPQASSSNAVWNASSASREAQPFFSTGTYYFGSVSGAMNHDNPSQSGSGQSYVMEIGHLGKEDSLRGRFFSKTYCARLKEANYQPVLRKVGSGTLTFGGLEIGRYEVNGGVLVLTNDVSIETFWTTTEKTQPVSTTYVNDDQMWRSPIKFGGEGGTLKLEETFTNDLSDLIVNSSAPISIDDGGVDREWKTALADSNTAGLTKKGAGTLRLSEKPLYKGLTTVEEGTLVVPEGTEVMLNAFYTNNVPVNATVVGFGYPAGTTLTGAESVKVFDGTLDISNVRAIDLSGKTLVEGQPYVIATADDITGYTRGALDRALTLPDGEDASKWAVRVNDIGGKRCLCVTFPYVGARFILR